MGIECPEDDEDVVDDEHDEEQASLDVPSNVPGQTPLPNTVNNSAITRRGPQGGIDWSRSLGTTARRLSSSGAATRESFGGKMVGERRKEMNEGSGRRRAVISA